MEEKILIEITEYLCGDCGGDVWRLGIGHRSDGKTELVITCGNPTCVESKREQLGIEDQDEEIIWDKLDITGQGYDREDIEEPSVIN